MDRYQKRKSETGTITSKLDPKMQKNAFCPKCYNKAQCVKSYHIATNYRSHVYATKKNKVNIHFEFQIITQ